VSADRYVQADDSAEGPAEASAEEPFEDQSGLELLFDPQQGSGELSSIKEQIRSLLRQNEELAPQAIALKQELGDLKERIQRSRDELAALEETRARRIKNRRESGQPQSLQLLQTYDMQYQKKKLEIELKLRELALQEKQRARERQLAELQKEIDDNAALEKQLAGEAEGPQRGNALVYELESLKQENILLEDQLKLPITPQGSEDLLGRDGPAWEAIRRKEEQKERLKSRIEQLQLENDEGRSSSDINFSVFEKEFRGSVERLEKENKQLKDQILLLREKTQKRSQ